MKKDLIKTLFIWLPFAAITTFVCVLGYLLVQQDVRISANDPQIEIAENVAQELAAGAATRDIVPTYQTDINKNLTSYIMVFDGQGRVVASSASLDGAMPTIPAGAFDYARQNGEDRFTWQPELGVRSAVILVAWSGDSGSGFVLAGRSLREVEKREDNLLRITAAAWVAGLIFFFVLIFLLVIIYKKLIVDR